MSALGRFLCGLTGHTPIRGTGYLNADRFSWLDPRIGAFTQCRCGAWWFTPYGITARNNAEDEALELHDGRRHDPKKRVRPPRRERLLK